MGLSSKRREDKRSPLSARHTVDTHKVGFERTTLKVSDDVNFFALDKTGTKRIDVIPYVAGEGNPACDAGDIYFERTFYVHRGIGPNQESYVCLAKTAKKPCPICEYRAKLQRDPNADEDLIKDLAPKERQLWNVIDRDNMDKGVQLWDISHHLFGKILYSAIRNSDEEDNYEFFADLEQGSTLKLGISEESFGGRTFYKVESIIFKPRSEPYDEDIIKQAHCLDECLAVLEYDKLKAIFLQTTEDEEEEEEKPKKSTKPKKEVATAESVGLKKGMQVEHENFGTCTIIRISPDGTSIAIEDEDGDLHKAIGVEDVEIVEKKKKVTKAAKEEEDDDWEDEEEEEKPSSKKSKGPKEENDEEEE